MTLQELDTINSIAIKADVDFELMLDIIGDGAADLGLVLSMAGKDSTQMKIICDAVEKILDKENERGENHE